MLNVFRMAGMMRGDLVKLTSSGAVGMDAILRAVCAESPISRRRHPIGA